MAPRKPRAGADAAAQARVEPPFAWAVNPHKLGLAKQKVTEANAAKPLDAEAFEAAVKAQYVELKGRLHGEDSRGPKATPGANVHNMADDDGSEDDEDESGADDE